jgi:Domain of unknown function (DUF5666)
MKKLVTLFLIGLIASFAVIASPAGAKKGKAHAFAGVVQSVGTDSITVKPRKGDPVTVQVNGDTKIVVNHKAGKLADIEVGYRALIKGKRGEPAKAIRAYEVPAAGTVVAGKVTSTGGDSITLQKRDGSSVTIGVTPDTKILVNGKAATLADVETGYHAVVRRTAPDGPAAVIRAYEKKEGGQKLLVRGVVDSVGSDSITLKGHGSATLTIHVTAQTVIRVGGQAGALSDIKAGYRAFVLRAGAGGDALAIIAFPPKH